MYKALQKQVQPRMLMILLVSIILMALIASYLYVIKKPFQELRQHQQTLALLHNEVQTGIPLQNQIEKQQQSVEQLNLKLHGTSPKFPDNRMVAYVIGELDKIADRHKVSLTRVIPKNAAMLFIFKELPFQVEISGDYFSLFAWLKDVEKNLGPIVIKQFDISPFGQNKERKMTLTLAAYQFKGDK